MKKLLFLAGTFFVYLLSNGCNSSSTRSSLLDTAVVDTTSLTASTDILSSDTTAIVDNKWEYLEDEDKMTSKKKYFASVNAKDLLEFDFPYNGGSVARLVVRSKDGVRDVMLRISSGQFKADSYDYKSVRVRFGDTPARYYSYSEAADGSSDVIFIDEASRFINNLKKFDRVIIEAGFYREGKRQIEFDISGFKWNH